MSYYRINYGDYSDQESITVEAESFESALNSCGISDELIWSIEKIND
jgi:hypothetical protein